MPNNFFSVESRFPNIENKTQDEINGELINYLYMLLEQLRYTLGNLGVGNFNESELDDIAGMISTPIYAKIEDAEGNIAQLTLTAEGLTSRVENAEGNISQLTQTAEGLISRISDTEGNISTLVQTSEALSLRIEDNAGNISKLTQTAESLSARIEDNAGNISQLTQTSEALSARIEDNAGNISQLTQTASSLTTRVSNAEGDISSLEQTATSLSARVSNAEGDISTLTQTASSLTTRVSNAEGDISSLEQTATKLTARVGDVEVEISKLGVAVSGAVTVSSLESQYVNTVINNATVTTTYGTISSQLGAGQVSFYTNGSLYGAISANANGLRLYTSIVMLLEAYLFNFVAGAGGITMTSGGGVTINANGGYFNVSSQYPPIFNGQYEFLRTDNMLLYIQNNAATIRTLLGIG